MLHSSNVSINQFNFATTFIAHVKVNPRALGVEWALSPKNQRGRSSGVLSVASSSDRFDKHIFLAQHTRPLPFVVDGKTRYILTVKCASNSTRQLIERDCMGKELIPDYVVVGFEQINAYTYNKRTMFFCLEKLPFAS